MMNLAPGKLEQNTVSGTPPDTRFSGTVPRFEPPYIGVFWEHWNTKNTILNVNLNPICDTVHKSGPEIKKVVFQVLPVFQVNTHGGLGDWAIVPLVFWQVPGGEKE